MSIKQRIEDATTGDPPAKAMRKAAKIKADALAERLADAGERSFQVGRRTITISEPREAYEGGGDPLRFYLEVEYSRGKVLYAQDQVIFNPPTSVHDGEDENGEPIIVEDTRRALRGIVANIVRDMLDKDKG